MRNYLLRRLAYTAGVMLGLTVFIFLLLRLAPGSPVYLLVGEYTSTAEIARLNHQYGFDQPLYVQYFKFIDDIAHGNLGTSIIYQTSAARLVLQRFSATLELTLCAILTALLIAIPSGLLMGIRRQSWLDQFGTVVAISGISAPSFWIGVMLIIAFSVKLGWFATSGRGLPLLQAVPYAIMGTPLPLLNSLRHLVLPTMTLAAFEAGFIARMTRSSILEEMNSNYVRTAHAKGIANRSVIGKHIFRNALLPVITVLGLEVGALIGGAVITETVFAWPGVGQLIFQAVSGRDYPLAQAGILLIGFLVIVVNLFVDLSYAFIDPRIKYETRR